MVKGSKHSPLSIKKMQISNKGKKSSPKTQFKKGQKAWNLGKKCPWTTKRNLATNHLMRGELAYNWRGGRTTRERKILMGRREYSLWRASVLERDSWTCQTCGVRGVELHSHHIKSWAEYPKLRYEIDNGVTLCRACHELTYKKNK